MNDMKRGFKKKFYICILIYQIGRGKKEAQNLTRDREFSQNKIPEPSVGGNSDTYLSNYYVFASDSMRVRL